MSFVGFDTSDDAGIYLINEGTRAGPDCGFFTPIVDDPFLFGQIAAANSLSDVYAMGGRPISSLSIVGFPEKGDPEILEQIIRGGLAKMNEANCSVIGGHSIRNEDMLFGYAVTGAINPHRIWRNVGGSERATCCCLPSRSGPAVIATALKKIAPPAESLDRRGCRHEHSECRRRRGPRGTGREVRSRETHSRRHGRDRLQSSGSRSRKMALGDPAHLLEPVSFEIDHASFSYFPGALEAAREGHLSAGLKNNRAFVGECATFRTARL